MKLALFDIDQTIYDGYSGSAIFSFLERKNFGEKGLSVWNTELERRYFRGEISYNDIAFWVIEKLVKQFKGSTKAEVFKLMEEFLEDHHIHPWVGGVLDSLSTVGFSPILVSGTTQAFVDVVMRRVGVEQGFGSEEEIIDGAYTGKLLNMLNHDKKQKLVDKLIKKQQPDLVVAFGDSTGDVPMFERADYVFVYEPEQVEMRKYVHENKNCFLVDNGSINDQVQSLLVKLRL